MELISLVEQKFESNPNKHIDNGNSLYINSEGVAFIRKVKSYYHVYFVKGCFTYNIKELSTLSTKQNIKLQRLLQTLNS